jgi:predicted N-acyltransferase
MVRWELLEGVAAVPAAEWNALVADESPFLEWEWLASLEEAGTLDPDSGWQPRPLVGYEGDRLVAAAPLYMKAHSEGEFVFDWGWAEAAERSGIQYYPKRLVGVPFSPVPGARLLVAADADRDSLVRGLAETLAGTCMGNELSGVHVNFCQEDEARLLAEAGFQVRIGIQYHWHNHDYESFDDYLAHFRSKRRNQIRRERREMDRHGVEIRALAGDEIPDDLFEPMYRFYLTTVRNHYWGRQYLNYPLFELLRERFRERLVFIVAYQDGEPIAGTFNVAKGKALYGRYWGATRPLRHLHFNVCYYAAVEYCIEQGLTRFEPGAGGEYKHLRGFDAQPTFSAHFLRDERFARAVSRFLEAERADAQHTLGSYMEQSSLKHAARPDPTEPTDTG